LAFIWLYQGLVPKLLLVHKDELAMFTQAGITLETAQLLVRLVGVCELVFGLILLLTWHRRWSLLLNIALMLLATIGVALTSPQYLGAAFNPITLNVAVAVLALVGFIASFDIPSARRCLRKPRKDG
jgi:hypothetical protein